MKGRCSMRKYNPETDEPRTGWDAFGIELAVQDDRELFVEGNEIWTKDKHEYVGKIREGKDAE